MKEFDTPQFTVGQTVRIGRYSTSPHYRVIDVFYWISKDDIKGPSQYMYTCVDNNDPTNIKQFCYHEIQDAAFMSDEQKICDGFAGKTIKQMYFDNIGLVITMTDGSQMEFNAAGDECAHITCTYSL